MSFQHTMRAIISDHITDEGVLKFNYVKNDVRTKNLELQEIY